MYKNFHRRSRRNGESNKEYLKYLTDEWKEEREQNPVEFIIEISENPREGEILNVVAKPWTENSKGENRITPPKKFFFVFIYGFIALKT